MPDWIHAQDAPKRFQFEPSSGTMDCSMTNNCGPTGSAQQADFYRNKPRGKGYSIEGGRRLAAIPRCGPTNAWQQAEILRKRGVPCDVVEFDGLRDLDEHLGYGRRPVGIGIEMSRVSANTRGHSFTGWHRITLLARGQQHGVGGYFYTDPNFSPPGGHRPDPKHGLRWMSRAELDFAFFGNRPAYAIAPRHKKE